MQYLDTIRFPGVPAPKGEQTHEPYIGHEETAVYGFACGNAKIASDYRKLLQSEGFEQKDECRFADSTFIVYQKDDTILHTAHYPAVQALKIVATRGEKYAVYTPDQGERFWTPSITQIGRKGALQWAPGMSYIIRNADGSYIIIDGGPYDAEDVDHLMTFLRVHQPKAGKPIIALWLFTHPHSDHMNLALAFWDKYHEEIDLRAVAFNFPNMDHTGLAHESPSIVTNYRKLVLEKLAAYFPDTVRLTPHAGDRYAMDGYVIETLPNFEDLYPDQNSSQPGSFGHINYFSLAWMIRSASKNILIMGDCGRRLSALIAKTCREDLKCDILQVCHHGNHGATMELYQYADPDICLWPEKESMLKTEPFLLGTLEGYEFNDWLWHSRKRLHLNNSITTSFELD